MQRVSTYKPILEEALGGKPTKAEEKVLAAAKAGRMEHLRPDGLRPDKPTAATRIRASLIRFLLLGGDERHPVHPKGVMLRSAWITGKLDFESCETQLDLSLWACHFEKAPIFDDAHLGGLYLPGCHLPGLSGQRMRLEESLQLRGFADESHGLLSFIATGSVDIAGARIAGQLSCEGGRFEGSRGAAALNCTALVIGAGLFLIDGFHATGLVDLSGTNITGQFACDGGQFDGAGAVALNGEAMVVSADVLLRHGFNATGLVNLKRSKIAGQLSCLGGKFDGGGGAAINGNALVVGASVLLSGGFHAIGLVNLVRADISGQLACVDRRFDGAGGTAINGNALVIGADVFLREGFHATGEVNLSRSRVFGVLQIQDAQIEGKVDLTEAEAGVFVDDADSWEHVESLRLSGFRYRSLQSRITVAERVQLLKRSNQDGLTVTATGKRHFLETAEDFDPRAYGELARAYLRQGERKAAAKVLEAREDRSRNAELRRAQAEELPGSGLATLGARARWLSMWAFKGLFGYGHRPARVFVTLIPLWIALTWFFGTVYDKGQFAPNSDVILTSTEWQDAVKAGCPLPADEMFPANLVEGCTMPLTLWTGDTSLGLPPSDAAKDYETFGPWLYAADLFLPLDTIGQTEAWAPSKDRGDWGWWGYYLRFPVQVFGWIIVAMSAAILTGLVGRRED